MMLIIGLLSTFHITKGDGQNRDTPLYVPGEYLEESPLVLVNAQRFDLMAKYLFAQSYIMNLKTDWFSCLYESHLRVWNGCHEEYPPSSILNFNCAREYKEKRGIREYIESFSALLDSIRTKGFDLSQSIIPTNIHKQIKDGAHRVSACLLFDKPVKYKKFDDSNFIAATAEYFKKAGLEDGFLDAMALQYCKLKSNTYVINLFPDALKNEAEVYKILSKYGTIVYEKNATLFKNGPLNLIRMLYEEPFEGWNNNFAKEKSEHCFFGKHKKHRMRFILFECDSLEKTTKCKSEIRAFFKSYDVIHINDTHEESILSAQTAFNNNSLHFINHASPKHFKNFTDLFGRFKQWIAREGYSLDYFCIDTSAVLSVYGIRECADLDYLHSGSPIDSGIVGIDDHDCELRYHASSKDDIVFNPENHFYFKGVKFCSLNTIKKLKQKRNEVKDQKDIKMINELLASKKAARC
ncbi:MAG: hypothetical protein HOH13_05905 [Crocinitomicaceae bacterium]|nr:hypothetical protein [Crocinitomicaceae bacterium]